MKVLFVADPLEKLKPASDTSLVFLRSFFTAGDQCFWAESGAVFWKDSGVFVAAAGIHSAGDETQLPQLIPSEYFRIDEFDIIFVRKEPPFDDAYLRLCQLLSPYESKLLFFNQPSLLLRYHEKMISLEAVVLGVLQPNEVVPTLVTKDFRLALQYLENLSEKEVILKPWLGHGGRDIQRFSKQDFKEKCEALYSRSSEAWMLQGFMNEIYSTGDRRVLFLGGEVVGQFARIPEKGGFVSNLAQGGSAVLSEQSASEKIVCDKLASWLRSLNIDFAGADFIGGKLSEVNITCPTGIQMWKQLTGEDLGPKFYNYLKKKRPR